MDWNDPLDEISVAEVHRSAVTVVSVGRLPEAAFSTERRTCNAERLKIQVPKSEKACRRE